MNETQLCTIEQIESFLDASAAIEFLVVGNVSERYEHISRLLKRFDHPGAANANAVCCGDLQYTSGYSRAQITRLVARWQRNRLAAVPLTKRYRAPARPFARKYTAADISPGWWRRTRPTRTVVIKYFQTLVVRFNNRHEH